MNSLNSQNDKDKADMTKEFVGEVVSIENDVVDVKNGTNRIHSFRIIGLDLPKGVGKVKSKSPKMLEMLEVGDKVRVNIERGRLTSIRKVMKNGAEIL